MLESKPPRARVLGLLAIVAVQPIACRRASAKRQSAARATPAASVAARTPPGSATSEAVGGPAAASPLNEPRRTYVYSSGPLPGAASAAPPTAPPQTATPVAPTAPARQPEPIAMPGGQSETIATNVAMSHLVAANAERIFMAGADCKTVTAMPAKGGPTTTLPISVPMMVEGVDGNDAVGCSFPRSGGDCALMRAPMTGGPARLVGHYDGWIAGSASLAQGSIAFARADASVALVSLADGSMRTITSGGAQPTNVALAASLVYWSAGRSVFRASRDGAATPVVEGIVTSMVADERDLWFLLHDDLGRVGHDATTSVTVLSEATPHSSRPEGKMGLSDSVVVGGGFVYWTSDGTWPSKNIHRLRVR